MIGESPCFNGGSFSHVVNPEGLTLFLTGTLRTVYPKHETSSKKRDEEVLYNWGIFSSYFLLLLRSQNFAYGLSEA